MRLCYAVTAIHELHRRSGTSPKACQVVPHRLAVGEVPAMLRLRARIRARLDARVTRRVRCNSCRNNQGRAVRAALKARLLAVKGGALRALRLRPLRASVVLSPPSTVLRSDSRWPAATTAAGMRSSPSSAKCVAASARTVMPRPTCLGTPPTSTHENQRYVKPEDADPSPTGIHSRSHRQCGNVEKSPVANCGLFRRMGRSTALSDVSRAHNFPLAPSTERN